MIGSNSDETYNYLNFENFDLFLLNYMISEMENCELYENEERGFSCKMRSGIFLTPLNNLESNLNRINFDWQDYVTKLINSSVLLNCLKILFELQQKINKLENRNKQLEKEIQDRTNKLLEVTRFEALGKMAGSIAHDIANIVSVIYGYNQVGKGCDDLKEMQQFIKAQENPIYMMLKLTNNLKQIAGQQKLEKKEFSPLKIINETIGILEHQFKKKSIKVKVQCSDDIKIFGECGQYSQICLNLAVNAIDAMESPGGELNINVQPNGSYIHTKFQDTGCGIPKESLSKIFDILYTTKPEGKGTGIGLFTMNEIVKKHNGKINVQSTVGKGTAFSFSLPVNK